MEEVKVGLIGLGTVGTGVAKILIEQQSLISQKAGCQIILKKIADRDLKRPRPVDLTGIELTTNADDIINDPEIDIVVELIGGYEPAKTFILNAIKQGKHVVTANKALLAIHGEEILQAAREHKVDIGFEASVGGGIPLIKGIKEGLIANKIVSFFGILNGTANYILTKMTNEGKPFNEVLKEAQQRGYAEADPTFDVEGIDTAHKLAILVSLCYGVPINYDAIHIEGISQIEPIDIQFAQEFGYRIKLLAISHINKNGIAARVHPTMIPANHLLANVNEAYNALLVRGDAVGNVLFYGLGAGMMPTGSAVVSDIVDISSNLIKGASQRLPLMGFKYEYRQAKPFIQMEDMEFKYYFRFMAVDRPGVLSKISGILGKYDISIDSVIQKGREIGGAVPIVMLTHEAKESNVRKALKEIETLEVVKKRPLLLRREDSLEIE